MKALAIIGISAVILLLIFICVDCSCGELVRYDCTVSGRHKVDAWTEITSSSDSDGNFTIHTTHHPDEFYLYCDDIEHAGNQLKVTVNSGQFSTITNGQAVMVKSRKGKWTKSNYLSRIE